MSLLSPYPSANQALVVEGQERGQVYSQLESSLTGATSMVVLVDFPGSIQGSRAALPNLAIFPDDAGAKNAFRGFGPVQPTGDDAVDHRLRCRSDGFNFPRAFVRGDLAVKLAGLSGHLSALNLVKLGGGSHTLRIKAMLDRRHRAAELVRDFAVLAVLQLERLQAQKQVWRDAYEVLTGSKSGLEPDPQSLESLMKHVTGATAWVTGVSARVGNSIETHLRLAEGAAEWGGTLHLFWHDAGLSELTLRFSGKLPENQGAVLSVRAQDSLTGLLSRWVEEKVGEAELDDALFIRGNREDLPFVVRAKDSLLSLARSGGRLGVSGLELEIQMAEIPVEAGTLRRVLTDVLEAWRLLILHRQGVQT
jgi:hypothetical protein